MSKVKKIIKKTMRQQISARLESTFGDLQQALGKTKFKRNIKKASKALAEDLKKTKDTPGEPILLPEKVAVPSPKKHSKKKS
jgi:hypothetical protein